MARGGELGPVVPRVLPPAVNEVPAPLDDAVVTNSRGLDGLHPQRLLKLISAANAVPDLGDRTFPINWFPNDNALLVTLPYRADHVLRMGIFRVDVDRGQHRLLLDGSMAQLCAKQGMVAYRNEKVELTVGHIAAGSSIHDSVRVGVPDEDPASEFTWSPDCRGLAYLWRHNIVGVDGRGTMETVVDIYDIGKGESHVLVRVDGSAEGLAWGRNGIFIARGQEEFPEGDPRRPWGELALIDPATGQMTTVDPGGGFRLRFLSPAISPNGETLSYGHDPFQVPPVASFMIPAFHDVATGVTKTFPLKENFALAASRPHWRNGSIEAVYRCKADALYSAFCVVRSDSGVMHRFDFDPLREISGAFAVSPRDGRVAWLSEDPNGRVSLSVSSKNLKESHDLYTVDRYELSDVALGELRHTRWVTSDGLHFGGLLVLPVNYVTGHQYPLIVDIHGGPTRYAYTSSLLNTSSLEWQMWAAQGYAVFAVDYRSSGVAGLKEEYHRRIHGYREDDDIADVLAGVDQVIQSGVADPAKIGAVGMSYGGIVLDWLVTHSNRLRAAIVKEGYPALWDGVGNPAVSTRVWLDYRAWVMGTDDAHRPEVERENAPITYANQVSTPILWVSGDTNVRGVVNVPRLYVNSINASGGTARLIFLPDEGHGFVKADNLKEVLASAIAWFDRYLKQ